MFFKDATQSLREMLKMMSTAHPDVKKNPFYQFMSYKVKRSNFMTVKSSEPHCTLDIQHEANIALIMTHD